MSLHDKIKKVASPKKSDWVEKSKEDLVNASSRKKSRRIALLVLERLDSIGMTQQELANMLGVSRQQVSKIVKGSENLTLQTISRLEEVLGISLIEINVGSGRVLASAITFNICYDNFSMPAQGSLVEIDATPGHAFDGYYTCKGYKVEAFESDFDSLRVWARTINAFWSANENKFPFERKVQKISPWISVTHGRSKSSKNQESKSENFPSS